MAASRCHLGPVAGPAALPKALGRRAVRYPLLLLAFASLPRLLNAQGVTTAAIQGTVAGEDGTPIAGASVRITNLSDGRRWGVSTRSRGGYLFEDVAVGGPYRIEVRALGFAPQARTGIVLALNQRLVAEFTLLPAAVELAPVAVDVHGAPPRARDAAAADCHRGSRGDPGAGGAVRRPPRGLRGWPRERRDEIGDEHHARLDVRVSGRRCPGRQGCDRRSRGGVHHLAVWGDDCRANRARSRALFPERRRTAPRRSGSRPADRGYRRRRGPCEHRDPLRQRDALSGHPQKHLRIRSRNAQFLERARPRNGRVRQNYRPAGDEQSTRIVASLQRRRPLGVHRSRLPVLLAFFDREA
ncbi:MAG: hypothetical protein DMD56_01140 [Gemmatimonadetes bacterium]|nr:MAG: hypothetical protein DMD56_01140 [Gemmatimonadota bacterium]